MLEKTKEGDIHNNRTYIRCLQDEEIVFADTSYKNVLVTDSRIVRTSYVGINNGSGETVNYKIFVTLKYSPIVLDINNLATINSDDPEWINILSVQAGGAYNHAFEKTLADTKRALEAFNNGFFSVLVQMKAGAATADPDFVQVYSKGQN